MASSERERVVFLGGFVAHLDVVGRLIDLQNRGITFELLPFRRFRVSPIASLSADDIRFLQAHRDEVRGCIEYSERVVTTQIQ